MNVEIWKRNLVVGPGFLLAAWDPCRGKGTRCTVTAAAMRDSPPRLCPRCRPAPTTTTRGPGPDPGPFPSPKLNASSTCSTGPGTCIGLVASSHQATTKPVPVSSINGHDSSARPKQHDQVTKCGCRTEVTHPRRRRSAGAHRPTHPAKISDSWPRADQITLAYARLVHLRTLTDPTARPGARGAPADTARPEVAAGPPAGPAPYKINRRLEDYRTVVIEY